MTRIRVRNRNTIESLGLWEGLHNPDFNRVQFDTFRVFYSKYFIKLLLRQLLLLDASEEELTNFYNHMKMTYKEHLIDARTYAEKRLREDYPECEIIVNKMVDFFTLITEKMDSVEIADEKQQYKLLLVVSFMRTHYVVSELIIYSEIIEASTLMRKQLELIARLKEIEVSELEKIENKVPQAKHVPWMKEYYGLLSQVAHNASLDSLDLLGYNMEGENHKRFYVQPTYTENTIEAFNMNIGLFMVFALEVISILKVLIPSYRPVEEWKFLLSINEYGIKTNIPYFESLKGMKLEYEYEDEK